MLKLLLLLAPLAQAQIYSSVDANGTRVFTDHPVDTNAKPVQLSPTNQIQAPSEALPYRVLRPEPEPVATIDYDIQILSPADDQSIQDGSGTLSISLSSEPALQEGHWYQALLNNKPFGAPSQQPSLILAHVDRGTHRLQVEIRNQQGQRQAISAPQTVHMRRISLSDRKRMNPCTLEDYGRRLECPLKDKPKPKPDIPFIPFI